MYTRAIVCPPAENFAQGLTSSELGEPDYQIALAQHESYCAALKECGLSLTKLRADPAFPDSTFVEDAAILFEPPDNQDAFQAMITRPGAASRLGETEVARRELLNFFPSVSAIKPPGTLDGGDICQAGNHFFIGISQRTNEAGAQQLAGWLSDLHCSTSMIDIRKTPRLLHLKSGIAYLGDRRLVVVDAIAAHPDFAAYDLVQIDPEEEYAANCIRVNDAVLIPSGYPKFESSLSALGYKTIALEMSEFQKMDGGLSCLSLRF